METEACKEENEPEEKIQRFIGKISSEKRLIVVLEKAALETVKIGNSFQLLNCDKHQSILKKYKRDPNNARPDILHQCLMMLLDSPLNQAGFLQIFIRTQRNILIQVNPQLRIPRTFDRFCGLMIQLLHKLSIRAEGKHMHLLKVIKNPITDYFPPGCRKIVTSFSSDKLVKISNFVPSDAPIVFVVGAMAHGSVDVDYSDEDIAISKYHLSAAITCSKLCTSFEDAWNII